MPDPRMTDAMADDALDRAAFRAYGVWMREKAPRAPLDLAYTWQVSAFHAEGKLLRLRWRAIAEAVLEEVQDARTPLDERLRTLETALAVMQGQLAQVLVLLTELADG